MGFFTANPDSLSLCCYCWWDMTLTACTCTHNYRLIQTELRPVNSCMSMHYKKYICGGLGGQIVYLGHFFYMLTPTPNPFFSYYWRKSACTCTQNYRVIRTKLGPIDRCVNMHHFVTYFEIIFWGYIYSAFLLTPCFYYWSPLHAHVHGITVSEWLDLGPTNSCMSTHHSLRIYEVISRG